MRCCPVCSPRPLASSPDRILSPAARNTPRKTGPGPRARRRGCMTTRAASVSRASRVCRCGVGGATAPVIDTVIDTLWPAPMWRLEITLPYTSRMRPHRPSLVPAEASSSPFLDALLPALLGSSNVTAERGGHGGQRAVDQWMQSHPNISHTPDIILVPTQLRQAQLLPAGPPAGKNPRARRAWQLDYPPSIEHPRHLSLQ